MTGTFKHVVKRSGIFQYYRRVPEAVVSRPQQFDALFGGKTFFRRSLGTRDETIALEAAAAARTEFEALVRQALGTAVVTAKPWRPLTLEFLNKVLKEQRYLTAKPYRILAITRESSPEAAEELERMLEHLEQDGETITNVLERNQPTTNPKLDVSSIADGIILRHGISAPPGSNERDLVQKSRA